MKLRELTLGVAAIAVAGSDRAGEAKPVGPDCRVVKVVDGKGRPIAGASISLLGCDVEAGNCKPPDIPSHVWLTDRSGRICAEELLDTDGRGALEVTAPERLGGSCVGRKHWPYPKGVPGAQGTGPIVVRLEISQLATAQLKGRIKSGEGSPIKGAAISVESIVVGDGCSFSPDRATAKSSADGRFYFAAIAKGTARLRVQHADFMPRTVSLPVPSPDAEVVLDEGATWQGRLLDPEGVPLPECRVAVSAGANWSTVNSCVRGRFSLRHLPAGDVDVVVTTDEKSPLGARAWKTNTRIDGSEQRKQDLSWPKGVTLEGTIVDHSGTPIADARLVATPDWPNRRPDRQVIVRADGVGHFMFRHLVPGRWVVEGDLRTVFKGNVGKLDIDATTNREQLRLIVPQPRN